MSFLEEPGFIELKNILTNKYSTYKDLIDIYFETTITQGPRLENDTISLE